jgi:hypothetical protein
MNTSSANVHAWRKSSASAMNDCVEVAFASADRILVRDSKAPEGPVLEFTDSEWNAFLTGVRSGEFDTG